MYLLPSMCMLAALLIALIVGSGAESIGRRFGLVDWPDQVGGRKRHVHPTPLVGGLACCLAVLSAAITTLVVRAPSGTDLGWFSIAVGAMYLIGVADDRHSLSPRTRLALSVGVLLMVLSAAPMFALGELRFSTGATLPLGTMGLLFTLVCLVGLINAVNMADGKNGLVISLCLIWCAVLGARAPVVWLPVIAAAAVALLVTLWFNMRGKLFLGDGGSYGLSTIFGLLAIHIHVENPAGFTADQVALLFAVPVCDTIRLVSIRMVRGTSPFAGDRDHLHHHLARRWGWPNGLYVYGALVGVPNLVAYLFPPLSAYALGGSVAAYALVIAMSHQPDDDVEIAPPSNVSPIRPVARSGLSRTPPPNEDAA